MARGVLTVRIVGDESGFTGALAKTQSGIHKFGKQIAGVGDKMSKRVTAPILAAATAIGGLAVKAASTGDAVAKGAARMGVSTDAFQEMDFWASQNGLSIEQLEKSVGILNTRVGQAAAGNRKYASGFEDIGVAIHDAEGNLRSTEDVMKDTIAALRDMDDPAERAAATAELLGDRYARDLLPALEDGAISLDEAAARAHELGMVMDKDAVDGSVAFTDALDEAKREAGALFRDVGANLLPLLTDQLLPAIRDHVVPAVRTFTEWLRDLTDRFANLEPRTQAMILGAIGIVAAVGPVVSIVGRLITVVGALSKALMFLAANPVGLVIVAIAALIAIGVLLWRNWDTITAKARDLWSNITGFFGRIRDGVVGAVDTMRQRFAVAMEGIKDAVRTQVNPIIGFYNAIIGGMEAVIRGIGRGLDRIPSFTVPDWVPFVGGKTFKPPKISSVSLGRIPMLEQGGEVLRTGLAVVHRGERFSGTRNQFPIGDSKNNRREVESLVRIEHAEFHEGIDVDLLLRRAAFAARGVV